MPSSVFFYLLFLIKKKKSYNYNMYQFIFPPERNYCVNKDYHGFIIPTNINKTNFNSFFRETFLTFFFTIDIKVDFFVIA